MRKKLVYKILTVGLMLGVFTSCYETEVSPVTDPTDYPTAMFTSSASGSINEGETLVVDIDLDKPLEWDISFDVVLLEGSTVDDHDIVISGGSIPAFKKNTQITIDLDADDVVEGTEKLAFEVQIHDDLAKKYLLSPETEYPSYDVDVVNTNRDDRLTINMSWAGGADYDFVIWSDTDDYPLTEWGDGGATGANPEIDHSIWLSDPAGTYYVNVMDWGEGAFDYTFSIGHPDGTIQTIEGTFTGEYASYINDPWTAWGGSYDSYRVLKVENDGTKFVVTKL